MSEDSLGRRLAHLVRLHGHEPDEHWTDNNTVVWNYWCGNDLIGEWASPGKCRDAIREHLAMFLLMEISSWLKGRAVKHWAMGPSMDDSKERHASRILSNLAEDINPLKESSQ